MFTLTREHKQRRDWRHQIDRDLHLSQDGDQFIVPDLEAADYVRARARALGRKDVAAILRAAPGAV